VRNRVKVPGKIRVNDLRMTRVQQAVYLPDRRQSIALGPIRVLLGLQVCLEDRLQDQNCCRPGHAIPDRRNAQRPELAVGLGI